MGGDIVEKRVSAGDVTVFLQHNLKTPEEFLVACRPLVGKFSDDFWVRVGTKMMRSEFELIRQFLLWVYEQP